MNEMDTLGDLLGNLHEATILKENQNFYQKMLVNRFLFSYEDEAYLHIITGRKKSTNIIMYCSLDPEQLVSCCSIVIKKMIINGSISINNNIKAESQKFENPAVKIA